MIDDVDIGKYWVLRFCREPIDFFNFGINVHWHLGSSWYTYHYTKLENCMKRSSFYSFMQEDFFIHIEPCLKIGCWFMDLGWPNFLSVCCQWGFCGNQFFPIFDWSLFNASIDSQSLRKVFSTIYVSTNIVNITLMSKLNNTGNWKLPLK